MYKYLLETLLSIILCIYSEVELPDHMVMLLSIFFEKLPYCFPLYLDHFTLPPTVLKSSKFSTSLLILAISHFLESNYPNGGEVSCCEFDWWQLATFKEFSLFKDMELTDISEKKIIKHQKAMVEIHLENSQNLQLRLVCFFHPTQSSSFLAPSQSLHFLYSFFSFTLILSLRKD